LAVYRESEDLINIGAYQKGTNAKVDKAIEKMDDINGYLKQDINEASSLERSIKNLSELAG
jgi:flagellum-specific ATP synthase